MQFGFFDDGRREYVIETPATPLPWINYLGSQEFFSLISNTAGGYCFYRDAKLQRLLRYRYNSVPADVGGRFFYIKEADGVLWSPTFHPADAALDRYRCRHGMGYTVFETARDGLSVQLTFFVPIGETCEVQWAVLKNETDREKTFRFTAAVEWCLWNAVDDAANFQRNLNTGEVEREGNVLYHTTEYRERRDHYAWYGVNGDIAGYDTDRDAFLGQFGSFAAPQAVVNGRTGDFLAHGGAPMAGLALDVTLAPGEERSLLFVLGYGRNPREAKFLSPGVIRKDDAHRVMEKFSSPRGAEEALAELRDYWEELLGVYRLECGDRKLETMVNTWHQYQCMVTFNMSRSASFYESGTGRGMGFRDSCQDLLGFVHMCPDRARERIIDIASIQFPDGSTYHQYQPLTKRGNGDVGSGFNDDPLWLVACTYAYIAETGDRTILDHPVPFDNRPGSEEPLMEHLRRSVRYTMTHLGPHGLPLIGRADWNDCLNLNCFSWDPNESFQTTENQTEGSQAESLMIAGLFVVCGRDYVELCRHLGKNDEANRAQTYIDNMVEAVKKHGWDGDWYLRAYDYFGHKVGSKENEEGQIFIESQGWCTMAGIGLEEGMVEKALDSVKERLDCEHGIVLNNPPFTRYVVEYGEISTYPAGYKENAGIFCHNNPWVIIGETVLGRGDRSWEYFRKICPSYTEEHSALHKVEPYVCCQMVAGKDAARPGEGKNSWLTGTAAWMWYAITQFILGIKPSYEGLEINPCIPSDWKGFNVKRKFRGAEYHITVKNPDGVCKGIQSITVDGRPIKGNVVNHLPGTHTVEVIMG